MGCMAKTVVSETESYGVTNERGLDGGVPCHFVVFKKGVCHLSLAQIPCHYVTKKPRPNAVGGETAATGRMYEGGETAAER